MEEPSTVEAVSMRERIIEAAEDLLRRHGPAKTKVVDVALHLKMSHANVYRDSPARPISGTSSRRAG